MPPYLRTHKLYLVPKAEDAEEIPADLSKLLNGNSIIVEEAEEPEAAEAAEKDAEKEDPRLIRMQEVAMGCIIDLEDILEVSEVYGRPELTLLVGRLGDYQRVITRPFVDVQEIWLHHMGEIL